MTRKKVTSLPAAIPVDTPPTPAVVLTAEQRRDAVRKVLILAWKLKGRLLHPVSLCARFPGLTLTEGAEIVAELRAEGLLPSEQRMAGEWWAQCP